ncbi:MAG: NADH-quinone oxidoreductase subunit N, partial [Nocardia sp.]|nr:NADH-quinone oxidoreductase subunit N [Nocardia sp.]
MSVELPAGAVLAASVPAPSIEYHVLAPVLIVLGAAVAGVLVDAFCPRPWRYSAQLILALAALLSALVAVLLLAGTATTAAVGAVAVDGVTLFLQGTLLLVGILSVLF